MTDFDPSDIPEDLPDAESVRSFLAAYKWPLLILGGLTVTAIVLSGVARRRGVPVAVGSGYNPGSLEREVQRSADWEASLRHFAAAVDTRMQGFQQQLDALHSALGTEGPSPKVSVGVNGAANQSYESATADQEENIPPGPASVSM